MLELDDIQHILLARAPVSRHAMSSCPSQSLRRAELAHGYPADGAVGSRGARLGRRVHALGDRGLHLERLRALGVETASLDSFPEEFKQGMVARA